MNYDLYQHWNENVVILMKFSSLAALEVVILTTFSAASDENFIKMKTFPFQWINSLWHGTHGGIAAWTWVNIGSGNRFLTNGAKPLPDPMLISR